MATATETTTQDYRIYIKATPEAIWEAITSPDWTQRYGYGGRVYYELRPGGAFRAHASEAMRAQGSADVIIEGEVVEADAPKRLVQTWHALFDDELGAEAATQLTFELAPGDFGGTKLTVTHELEGAPLAAAMVGGSVPGTGGGWAFVLSDMKTLLETGASIAG
jgi:uncharacterized protein YndB with AHSA1/START domain